MSTPAARPKACVGYRLDRAAVAEDDEWGVNITLTTAQAPHLAELLRAAPTPADSPQVLA